MDEPLQRVEAEVKHCWCHTLLVVADVTKTIRLYLLDFMILIDFHELCVQFVSKCSLGSIKVTADHHIA